MALSNLASPADLEARGIVIDEPGALLASASASIRGAAGCSITTAGGTVTFPVSGGEWFRLPGWAIREVSAVALDDVAITDWRLVNGSLYRADGWGSPYCQSFIEVTYTQGLTKAPADIIDLACSLVAAANLRVDEGYDSHQGISSEKIDDYQRVFLRGEDATVSPMELPVATRLMLANRFGGGAYVTSSR